ncbi:hypothetical protein 44RRORF006c [Aeromonas phage 44RR2.8t]|uniref:Uncharacterized protein n=2 Tax=Biquartavirus 44RR2 TaxID=115987 RepID=Q6U9U6_9CAUD|nr:hypothetical protein ST44RRORF006c [Aeromonas phage 44RR2.8t]AAQ81325.1 hypothetical protein 44RRORF006c [Aeromonas phage 44RR2.8t]APU00478.1 hypothetical protein [Aeromonas phage 44RR2.8t.2]
MTIKRIRFKSEEHRKKFAESEWYNESFSKHMPDEFWAKYDSNKLVGYMLVDANGKKIELPEEEGGGGITFDDEEMFHFFDEVK